MNSNDIATGIDIMTSIATSISCYHDHLTALALAIARLSLQLIDRMQVQKLVLYPWARIRSSTRSS